MNRDRQDGALSASCLARFGLAVAGAAAAGTVATGWLLGWPSPGIDDAYITLVYGRNLALGHGYVYTPGFEHVEGSTSLLWTLVAALAAGISAHPQIILFCVSVAASATAIAAFAATVDRLVGSRDPGKARGLALLLSLFWALAQLDFFAWNTWTLMDSAVWSMGIALAIALLVHDVTRERLPERGVTPALLFAGLALARPEAMVLVPALVALTLLALPRPWSGRAIARRYGPGLVAFAVTEAALLLFRWKYFGYPLPNTYYVKAPALLYALQKGLGYLAWFARSRPWSLPLLAVTGLEVLRLGRSALGAKGLSHPYDRGVVVAGGAAVLGLLLPLPTGGDGFGSFRLLQPFALFFAIPAIPLLLSSVEVTRWWGRAWWVRAAACAALLLALAGIAHRFRGDNLLGGEFAAAREGQRAGAVLAAAVPTGTTVGVIAAGGVAWTYPGRVLDLLGLNWPKMAHAPGPREGVRHGHGAFQEEVFWADPPDVLVFDLGSATRRVATENELRTPFASEVLKGLLETSRFELSYSPGCLANGDGVVSGYFARKWLAEVAPASYSAVPCRVP